jgi:uncharacterized membrane protein
MATLKLFPILLLTLSCTTPAPPAEPSEYLYQARGQEPGWTVAIASDWIEYVGNYGETKFLEPRPTARPTFNSRRYETPRLIVDITYSRCNDAMSGHGYADQVMVIVKGETYRGCGGQRRPDWDN